MMNLNERQRRFAHEYVKCGVLAQAARNAGYPGNHENYQAVQGQRLIRNDKVTSYIDKLLSEADEAKKITPDAIAKALLTKAEHSERDADQIRALELLGKSQGMFRDVHESRETQEIGALLEQIRSLSPAAAAALAKDLGLELMPESSSDSDIKDSTG